MGKSQSKSCNTPNEQSGHTNAVKYEDKESSINDMVCHRRYIELFGAFRSIDSNEDNRIDFSEFSQSIGMLKRWGLKMGDPEEEFADMDYNSRGDVSFNEFCNWAMKKNFKKYKFRSYAEHPFLCIADMDQDSVVKDGDKIVGYQSLIQYGTLIRDGPEFKVDWSRRDTVMTDQHDGKGRGMELSDGMIVDDLCLTFDDRTGTVFSFEPDDPKTFKKVDAKLPKMKIEWCFQRCDTIFYGSHMDIDRDATCNIAEMDANSKQYVRSLNMQAFVKKLGEKIAAFPGVGKYHSMTVEAASYSDAREEIVIVPRMLMHEKFDPNTDTGCYGWNKFIIIKWRRDQELEDLNTLLNEDIKIISLTTTNDLTRGFSSCDWIPADIKGYPETILTAIESVETRVDGVETVESYMSVFDIEGNVFMKDVRFPGSVKYEGFLFFNPKETLTGASEAIE